MAYRFFGGLIGIRSSGGEAAVEERVELVEDVRPAVVTPSRRHPFANSFDAYGASLSLRKIALSRLTPRVRAAVSSATSTAITLLPPPVPALPTTTVPQYAGPGQSSTRMTRVLAILQAACTRSGPLTP